MLQQIKDRRRIYFEMMVWGTMVLVEDSSRFSFSIIIDDSANEASFIWNNQKYYLARQDYIIKDVLFNFCWVCYKKKCLYLAKIWEVLRKWTFLLQVEEGCQFTSVDSIAEAVHHMLRIIIERDDVVPFLLTY